MTKSFELQAEPEQAAESPAEPEQAAESSAEPEQVAESQAETNKVQEFSEPVELNLDTLCLIPDERRFYLVWRGLCPVRDLTGIEVKTIEVGQTTPAA